MKEIFERFVDFRTFWNLDGAAGFVAGAALVYYGFRDTTSDIDLQISQKDFDRLHAIDSVHIKRCEAMTGDGVMLPQLKIDCKFNCMATRYELQRAGCAGLSFRGLSGAVLDGKDLPTANTHLRIQTLTSLLEMKRGLAKHRKRPKDYQDVRRMESALNRKIEHSTTT